MENQSEKFLYDYLNSFSPTGFESTGQKVWMKYIEPYVDDLFTDAYGTAVGVINPSASYKVVVEAHADEISWFVNYISDEGYIYVIRNGGSDHQIAPSKTVILHGEKGPVKGVFGWPAIHVRNRGKELAPSLKNIFIDVGCCSKSDVNALGVYVGTVITFDDELFKLNNDYWCGRALDNRMGGFMIAQVARDVSEDLKAFDFGVYFVNAVQEEIGLRGAQMIAERIKPDIAIVTDVCHDTHSPLYDKKRDGDQKAGEGPVLTVGPAVHNLLLQDVMSVAKAEDIPFQRSASSRSTGTDTDAFAYSNQGVPSALISLPLKYMHTTVEMTHINDVQSVSDLIAAFLRCVEKDKNYRYL